MNRLTKCVDFILADLLQLRGVAASESLILLMAMGGGCDNVVPRSMAYFY